MTNVSVIGGGHVGLVTASCLASLGCRVVCVENNLEKLALLQAGRVPIFEPELEKYVQEGLASGQLTFTREIGEAVEHGVIVFVCVGTPEGEDGSADLSQIENVAVDIAFHLTDYRLIVEKSTVPIRTHERIHHTIRRHTVRGADFEVACNPEFLREGSAIHDFFNPSRIVLGVESERGKRLLLELYKGFPCPKMITDQGTAELIKHVSNAFLATKVSFANLLSDVCEALGANVNNLLEGMGYDPRIGRDFMVPGVGFGGNCLPKDMRAFMHMAGKSGIDISLLKAVEDINVRRPAQLVEKVEQALWILKDKCVTVWGLSFKANTDDVRNAASVEIVSSLAGAGAKVTCYDPLAMPNFQSVFPDSVQVTYASDLYNAVQGSHALILLTEWEVFRNVDLERVRDAMALPIIVDGRGVFNPRALRELGFEFYSFGTNGGAQLEVPDDRSRSTFRGARS